MTTYFIRRFLLIIPTFFGITLITFLILQFVPGGPLETAILKIRMGGDRGSESGGNSGKTQNIPQSAVDELTKFYGFDKPIHERYIIWLGNLLKFDLGKSYVYQEPVLDVITSQISHFNLFRINRVYIDIYSLCSSRCFKGSKKRLNL